MGPPNALHGAERCRWCNVAYYWHYANVSPAYCAGRGWTAPVARVRLADAHE